MPAISLVRLTRARTADKVHASDTDFAVQAQQEYEERIKQIAEAEVKWVARAEAGLWPRRCLATAA